MGQRDVMAEPSQPPFAVDTAAPAPLMPVSGNPFLFGIAPTGSGKPLGATRRAAASISPCLGLQPNLDAWAAGLRIYGIRAMVLRGPHASEPGESETVLTYPERFTGLAARLVDADFFRAQLGGSLVEWRNLTEGADLPGSLAQLVRETGAASVVRVEIPLPFQQAFQCYVLCGRELAGGNEAAVITWAVLNLWPSIKSAVSLQRLGISDREFDVLSALAEGHKAIEVARMLDVTPRTVQFHSSNVVRKLSASNIASAVQRACALGIL